MSSAHIRIGEAMSSGAPIYNRIPRKAEQIAASGTSAQSTITANAGEIITVSAIGGNLSVLTGNNPTAIASGAGCDVVLEGQSKDFGPAKDLDKVAVIDLTAL